MELDLISLESNVVSSSEFWGVYGFCVALGSLSFILFYFVYFFFISWRLITLQNCSGFCHTLTRISHGFTCSPHPDPGQSVF